METLNIKMTTQQSIELGLVQITDVHVNDETDWQLIIEIAFFMELLNCIFLPW